MALPIASSPVLTGKVAEEFERKAQEEYQRCLNRTEEENRALEESLKKDIESLNYLLAKSHIGGR
jgi:Skp family chaperone for outer membrane proteins